MKKSSLFALFIIFTILISGCGGGGGGNPGGSGETGTITGRVVDFDQPDQGIGNMVVQIGSKSATTESNGNFSIAGVELGSYWVTASGPARPTSADPFSGNHLAGSLQLTVVKGENSCGPLPVYHILGYGVTGNEVILSEQTAGIKTQATAGFGTKSLQNVIKQEPMLTHSVTSQYRQYNKRDTFRAASIDVFSSMVAYIYLKWKPFAQDYKIYFGSSEEQANMIWDSQSSEEAFDPSNPEALLDMGVELYKEEKNIITTAGVYQFLIVGYNTDGSKFKELPVISVSFGMNSAPSGIRFSGNQLSWGIVDGAEYNVKIYNDYYVTLVYDYYNNPSHTLISQNTIDLTGRIEAGVNYSMKMQAYTFDRAGWTSEINMTLTNFKL